MIPHPLGDSKKEYLQTILYYSDEIQGKKEYLGALFPEIYYLNKKNEYYNIVIKRFKLKELSGGDQTTSIINKTQEFLNNVLHHKEITSINTIRLVEETVPDSAIRFLASHYYYHSMFKWFWRMFDLYGEHRNSHLYHMASEIAYSENKPMSRVRYYIDLSLKYGESYVYSQRLWNKLSVFYTLRGELINAKDAIEESKLLLKYVDDAAEKQCRLAEYYNSLALISVKENDYENANRLLLKAKDTLNGCIKKNERFLSIEGILEENEKKLDKLKAQFLI
ncbi:hypothetical protein [Bacillus cereus]|uniref:hypothetical protein n=1 Tax=Bacillus cereus TaxID=1396 RepID=UPI0025B24A8B|nr:hypothetical protein [Bacillus cereus]WJX06324.1 hypothetical protein QTA68_05565 [Bacillus cereus]